MCSGVWCSYVCSYYLIAVMAETTADEIRIILEQMGICKKRIVWIRPYTYPVSFVEWKSEKIG